MISDTRTASNLLNLLEERKVLLKKIKAMEQTKNIKSEKLKKVRSCLKQVNRQIYNIQNY